MNSSAPFSQSPVPAQGPQPSHAHHAVNHGFDWREYYFALKARAWIVVLCVTLATLWGIFSAVTQQGLYTARSILVIQQGKSKVLSEKLEGVSDEQIRGVDQVNTLVEVLRSYPFALRVVNHQKLANDREFLSAAGFSGRETSPERAAAALSKMVNPSYRLNTRLIDINLTSRNPSVSVKLANAYADEYLRYVHDQKAEASRSASTFLMEESDRLRKKMKGSEEGMQSFREREKAASMESMLQEAQTQLTQLSARQSLIQSKLTQINSDLEVARANKGKTKELLRLPSVAGEPKVAALITQLSSLEKDFVLIQQRYRAKHPAYISVNTQLDLANKELNKVFDDIVGLLESIRTSLIAQQNAANLERESVEKRLLEVTSKSIEYNDLKRELESDTALYNAVLGRIKEVDVTKEISDSPVAIQERANGAFPVSKPPLNILLQSIFTGLALGVGIVIGLHKLDTSMKTVDQLEHLTGVDVAAAIPQIGGDSKARFGLFTKEQQQQLKVAWGSAMVIIRDASIPPRVRLSRLHEVLSPAIAMIAHPHIATALPRGGELVVKDDRSGVVAESFRSLRATIATNARVEKQRTFLVSSAIPSEGKSFCSSNFATTLAQQGLRTLLVDADLRKPTISGIFFGMNRKPGLSEVLMGSVNLPEAVNPAGIEGLSILSAGGRSSNPSELLAGEPFRKFIEEALKQYDRVVIDSAPILAVSDTLLLAPYVDVVCLVIRAYMTPRKMIQRAVKSLKDIHVQPAGLIFNCIPVGSESYSYSGKYYGSYGSKGVYGS